MTKKIETIIIGAGVAGLGCAHQLMKHKKDFMVLTEDLGGRIITAENKHINYGACFVLSNFKHILPFVRLGEKLRPFSVEFHDEKGHPYSMFKICKYPLQTLRLYRILSRFTMTYELFKEQCEQKSQKNVIESDPWLMKLHTQSASDFIKEKNIAEVAENYLSQGVYMCTFLPLTEVSAFDFLRLCLSLIIPAHEFVFLPEKATTGFADKITIDSVVKINNGIIQTKSGRTFQSQFIVIATPPQVAKELLGLYISKAGSDCYMFHLTGTLKPEWSGGQFELFKPGSNIVFIRKQSDGSYILYTKMARPDFEEYFSDFEIIFQKYWQPAFYLTGSQLLDCEQGKNMYLAGDYNVVGLEDAYITGMLAANKILRATNK